MTTKQALDTISKTPWLLAIPILALSIVAIMLTWQGEITVAAITKLAVAFGSGAVTGGAYKRQKRIASSEKQQ